MLKNLVLIIISFFFSITSYAETKIPFTLDWKFEGPSAPFFNSIDKGYFKDEWSKNYKYNKDMTDWDYSGPRETAEVLIKYQNVSEKRLKNGHKLFPKF